MKKIFVFLTFLTASLLMAQTTGKIVGKVTDKETGEGLVSSVVTINPYIADTTDTSGRYSITGIPPGKYDVEFSYVGYEPIIIKGVIVDANKVYTVNGQLTPKVISGETVTVNVSMMEQPLYAMTWKKVSHNSELGIDFVHIFNGDPYNGDTEVTAELPILAIKKEYLPRPPYDVHPTKFLMPKEYYEGWAGGHIALTKPIRGTELTSLEKANKYCEEQCGKGYRMAEFHDGDYVIDMNKYNFHGPTWPDKSKLRSGGWGFYAYGNISTEKRFWVYINDQHSNCWDRMAGFKEISGQDLSNKKDEVTAKIKIDIDRVVGEIDPNIYGIFMEPIQFDPKKFGVDALPSNTMYGTLYDPGSPFANKDGFNTLYIEAAKELKITNMRWPGGNYVAGYNWQDGIGPNDQRPVRKDLAWGALDNNNVGTDEWVKLCRAIGAENVICINMGTGTLNDARYWVEYCNSEKGSYYADLRAKYGNKTPYNVKYWCLGNEVDGEPWIMGYKNAEDYCKFAKEAAKIMKYTDNKISFIANGSSNYDPQGKWVDWNLKIITELRDIADYISIHRYWESSPDYYVYMGQHAMDVEEKIKVPADIISTVRAKYKTEKPIYISFDEWAPFGRGLLPTLALAQYFNSFIRHADVVKMANFTLLTGILERDKNKGMFKTPLFHTFKLFSNNCRGRSLDVSVECDTFSTNSYYKNIPYLDVTCVYSKETSSIILNVVNRHKDKAIVTDITCTSGSFRGKAVVSEINSDDIQTPYTFDKQYEYLPRIKGLETKVSPIKYSFPAHSFTQIIIKTDRQGYK